MCLTIVLVGAHGAGKTTLGRRLAARLGVPFHDEVGRRLAERCGPDRTAADPQEGFDEAVFREELARDQAFAGPLRIVETWHPGNLAYAARRSPAVRDRHLPTLRLGPAVVLPIRVSLETAAARQSEPGDPAFFAAVGAEAEDWARRLGLLVLPPLHNDGPLEVSVAAALLRLSPTLPESA